MSRLHAELIYYWQEVFLLTLGYVFWFHSFTCTVQLLFHSFLKKVRGSFKIRRPRSSQILDVDGQGVGVLKTRQFSWTSYIYFPTVFSFVLSVLMILMISLRRIVSGIACHSQDQKALLSNVSDIHGCALAQNVFTRFPVTFRPN